MEKLFTAIGLMSGTSGDGVDASLIKTDGNDKFELISNHYFEYPAEIFDKFHNLVSRLQYKEDLEKNAKDIDGLERETTLFTAKIINEILKNYSQSIDLIGYHGQTIYHDAKNKVTKQIGNANLLSNLTHQKVIFNFRENDINNGGQGAPLTPIFHKMLSNKFNLNPSIFINIGGITNATTIENSDNIFATDIGPGMCLIDKWIRKKTQKKFDENGDIAFQGKVNMNLDYELENFYYSVNKNSKYNSIKSFSTNDFDINFVRGLSLEDGAATLSQYTVEVILDYIKNTIANYEGEKFNPNIILCGGGRKNKYIINNLEKQLEELNLFYEKKNKIKLVDNFGVDGDFVESQAFAYLSVRSLLELPITFPNTTGCIKPVTGGNSTR